MSDGPRAATEGGVVADDTQAAHRGAVPGARPAGPEPAPADNPPSGSPTPTPGRPAPPSVWVLVALIMVATVANLNLAVANVALPDIGKAFDASQTALNLVSVGYSLGLAASVLYFGAVGDRYGRKLMLILGMSLTIPACLLAAYAPSIEVLFLARLLGGLAAGMAYPTTLALITALWKGPARTKAIALWSATGGAIAALGSLLAGWLLDHFAWGSVFLVTAPLAVVALIMAILLVPAHVNETADPVDNLGGIMSIVLIASFVLAINFAPVPGSGTFAVVLGAVALVAGVLFVWRQRRAPSPLFDLHVAARRIFWVAACAGIIVFGSLMAGIFIGQQFLQNVLGYSPLESGAAMVPAALAMVIVAPFSARFIGSRGSRFTLLLGYAFCALGLLVALVFWQEDIGYWPVLSTFVCVGIGVGLAGTPASHSLTGSVPVSRAGMASGTADLQRDLGGAVMQSMLGALLTAGYASAFASIIAATPGSEQVSAAARGQLLKSFGSAADIAQRYPEYSNAIISAAKTSFLHGDKLAYMVGLLVVLGGAAIVWFLFPRKDREQELLAEYAAEDARVHAK
ncbi:MAG TPA: MFS transporter [Nakamurella sp.]|nr:MFS transporter [Nakamurella sp.]